VLEVLQDPCAPATGDRRRAAGALRLPCAV